MVKSRALLALALAAVVACLWVAGEAQASAAPGAVHAFTEGQWLRMHSFPATPVVFGAEAEAALARFAEVHAAAGAPASEESSDESSGDESSDESSSAGGAAESSEESSEESSSEGSSQPTKLGYDHKSVTLHAGRKSVIMPATRAVLNLNRLGVARRVGADDPLLEANRLAAAGVVSRECPRHICARNSTCPIKGGVCCQGSSHCCPQGATCLNTQPPTCVHDGDAEPNRCADEECAHNFHCPHDDVSTCCIGGNVCCPKDFKCRATSPPTCEKILSPGELKLHLAMEDREMALKKAALADAISDAHAKTQAALQAKIDEHALDIKQGEAAFKANTRKAQTAHTSRERLNAAAAAERYQNMVKEDREKKGALSTDRKERAADAAQEAGEKRTEVEKKIAAHAKQVGHLDAAEAGRKRRDSRALERAAQERRQKEAAEKKEQRIKEQKTKEMARKAKAQELAAKKQAEQGAKAKQAEQQHKQRAAREVAGKKVAAAQLKAQRAKNQAEAAKNQATAARTAAAAARQKASATNEAAAKESKAKAHSRNVGTEQRAKEQQKKAHSRNRAVEQRGKEQQRKSLSRSKSTEQRGKEQGAKRLNGARAQEQAIKRRNAPFDLTRGARVWHLNRQTTKYDLGGNVDYIKSIRPAAAYANDRMWIKLEPAGGARRREAYNHCETKSRCVQNGGTVRTCVRRTSARRCVQHRAGGCAHWGNGGCVHWANNVRCGTSCRNVVHRYWRNRPRRRTTTCRTTRFRFLWHWRTRRHCTHRWVGGGRYLAARTRRVCNRHCRTIGRRCVRYAGRRCLRSHPSRCVRYSFTNTCVQYRTSHRGCARYAAYRSCSRRLRWVGGGSARTYSFARGGVSVGVLRGMRYATVVNHARMTPPRVEILGRRA